MKKWREIELQLGSFRATESGGIISVYAEEDFVIESILDQAKKEMKYIFNDENGNGSIKSRIIDDINHRWNAHIHYSGYSEALEENKKKGENDAKSKRA